MKKQGLLALGIAFATIAVVAIGTIFPVSTAIAYAGGQAPTGASSSATIVDATPGTAQAAVDELGRQMKLAAWGKAYSSLANKAEFSQEEFVHDLTGYALSLRTYATLDSFEVSPIHETSGEADEKIKLHWSSVVGAFDDTRDLHLVKNGGQWAVDWPIVRQQHVPPQVIAVNYLRWDVIHSGGGDDWGAADVESPHVRLVDMHPVNRADGAVVMGELLNEDIIPAYVTVKATLVAKNGQVIDSEGTFDMISHTLLPKQVTPFIIQFPGVDLSQVGSIRMAPTSILVAASADPVIELQNQKLNAAPGASLVGQLSNQSGQVVNVAHVLTTFYDKDGQVVWVGGQYIDRALLPQTPVDFRVTVPEDLAKRVTSQRSIVATYSTATGSAL